MTVIMFFFFKQKTAYEMRISDWSSDVCSSQVTTLSSNGDFSQSTSLVAQSLSIEVNQDTGEVSVSLAKLSFEQDIRSGQGAGGGQQPLQIGRAHGLNSSH